MLKNFEFHIVPAAFDEKFFKPLFKDRQKIYDELKDYNHIQI